MSLAFFLLAAVLFGFVAAALVNGQNGVFVEDKLTDAFDGEFAAVRAESDGFRDGERLNGFYTCLDGFFLGAQFAQFDKIFCLHNDSFFERSIASTCNTKKDFLALHVVGKVVGHAFGCGDEAALTSEGDYFFSGHLGEVTAGHAEGTLNGVEEVVFIFVKPDEVFRTIVVNITIQMVALLPFFSFAMEGTADETTDKATIYLRIIRMAIRDALEIFPTMGYPLDAVPVVDVSFIVRQVLFAFSLYEGARM